MEWLDDEQQSSLAKMLGLLTGAGTVGKEWADRIGIAMRESGVPRMSRADLMAQARPGDVILSGSPEKIDIRIPGMKASADARTIAALVSEDPMLHSQVVTQTGKSPRRSVLTAIRADEPSVRTNLKEAFPEKTEQALYRRTDLTPKQAAKLAKGAEGLRGIPYGGDLTQAKYALSNIFGIGRGKPGASACAPSDAICHQLTSVAHSDALPKNMTPKDIKMSKQFELVGKSGGKMNLKSLMMAHGVAPVLKGLARGGAVGLGTYGLMQLLDDEE